MINECKISISHSWTILLRILLFRYRGSINTHKANIHY